MLHCLNHATLFKQGCCLSCPGQRVPPRPEAKKGCPVHPWSLVLNPESRAGLNWGRNVGGDQIAQLGKWHQTKISNGGRVFIERHTSRPEMDLKHKSRPKIYLFQLYRWWTFSTFLESQAFIELRRLFPSLDLWIQYAQHFEVYHSKKEDKFSREF